MFFKKDASIEVGDSPLINTISSPLKLVNQSLQSVGIDESAHASLGSTRGIRSQFFSCPKEISRYEKESTPYWKK